MGESSFDDRKLHATANLIWEVAGSGRGSR
jgi:hypothetical protein